MINKQQFKRLTIVLTIPLLLLGWWMAENEVLLKTNYLIDCEEYDTHFHCYGYQTTRKSKDEFITQYGGVLVRNSTRLTNGFNHPVVTLGIMEQEYKNGALHDKQLIGAGIRKTLFIDRNIGANYNGNGPCRLSPYADNISNWHMWCVRESPGGFTFQNESTVQKFNEMFRNVKQEEEKFNGYATRAYIAQILAPLLSYIAISVILLTIAKLIGYVINGRRKT